MFEIINMEKIPERKIRAPKLTSVISVLQSLQWPGGDCRCAGAAKVISEKLRPPSGSILA